MPASDSTTFLVQGQETISYAQFGSHVRHRALQLQAWSGQTIALWADNGPDFVVDLFAIWQVGAIPMLVSRRLPWPVVASLLRSAQAGLLLAADPAACGADGPSVLPAACAHGGEARIAQAADAAAPEIGSARQPVAVILHTSGTTHIPKLVRIGRAQLSASLDLLQARWGQTWRAGDASLGVLPLFHVFGLCAELLQCYRRQGRYCFCAANPHDIVDSLQRSTGEIARLCTVPWMLEQLLDIPGGVQALQRLRYVVVGGAALSDALGKRLTAAGIRVIQGYGMTEVGTIFMSELHARDWREMTPVIPPRYWHLEDGTGQLIIHSDCPSLCRELPGDFPTGDLFEAGPNGSVRYVSRVDDILVHSSGEKSNALAIEQLLLGRLGGLVAHAAVIGSGRLRLAAILLWRKPPTAADRAALLRGIAAVNAELPDHSRLLPHLLLLLAPDQAARLPLTGKKTVARHRAEAEFEQELAALYAGAPAAGRGETLEAFFERPEDLDPDVSLFAQGMDSLDAASLGMHLAKLHPERDLPLNLVYRYPTLNGLRRHLAGASTATRRPPVFPPHAPIENEGGPRGFAAPRQVLLTGSTGFIGRHLVEALLGQQHVEHVHCPVRKRPSGALPDARVTYYEGYAFSNSRFGLSPEVHRELLERVDTVIHAAWPVDFNATYGQLADSTLASVRHLIEFSRPGNKCLHFLSSVATVMLHPTKQSVDEELPLSDAAACVPIGYAQTKWEAEHLIVRSGVRHKIYRLAEVSGHSVTGEWNERDHVPILARAARELGCMPQMPQPLDWVPVDVACRALLELMTVPGSGVHHIANPRPREARRVDWGIPSTPLRQWLRLAEPHLHRFPRLVALWPFLKELEAWSDRLTTLDARTTCVYSPALAACEPIEDVVLQRMLSRLQGFEPLR